MAALPDFARRTARDFHTSRKLPMLSQGSIRRIETGNPRLQGFEVNGKIRKEDVEWMARSVEPALELPGKIDMIIIMSDYEGMELGAAFDAQSLKTQAKSATE